MQLPLQRKSLATEIYEDLRARIATGGLMAGTTLALTHLAEEYQVSPGPVRDAISTLARDGLVQVESYQQPIVRRWGRCEVRALLDARLLIERQVVDDAVARIMPQELDALRVLNARIEEMVYAHSIEDLGTLIDLDAAFHQGLVRAAGNPVIERMYASLPQHLLQLRHAGRPLDPAQHARMVAQHSRLLDAYAARHVETARALVTEHIETIGRANRRVLVAEVEADAIH